MQYPRIGIGVIVRKDDAVLIGQRKGAHGDGHWQFPGGHLEFNEDVFDCAQREVSEEAGISIENLQTGPYTNDVFKEENRHYITLFVIADHKAGVPKVLEPKKCRSWQWITWSDLPEPLFLPIENLKRDGFDPFVLA